MSETTESAVCPICSAIVADEAAHAKWHRDLPGSFAKRQSSLGV